MKISIISLKASAYLTFIFLIGISLWNLLRVSLESQFREYPMSDNLFSIDWWVYLLPLVSLGSFIFIFKSLKKSKSTSVEDKSSLVDELRKIILPGISICVTILILSFGYPKFPSLSQYDFFIKKEMEYNIHPVYDEAATILHSNDYQKIENNYIKGTKDVGYAHFKIVPDNSIQNNILLLQKGDYSPIYPITVIDTGIGIREQMDSLANNKNELDDSVAIASSFADQELLNKSNSFSWSASLTGAVGECYKAYTILFDQEGNQLDRKNEKNYCFSEDKPQQIYLDSSTRFQTKLSKVEFWVEPKDRSPSQTGEKMWNLESAKVLLDKSGNGSQVSNLCVEGTHEGNPGLKFHLSKDGFQKGACPIS